MVIDLVVLAVVLVSAIISFFRGLVREVLTIAGLFLGLLAAYFFGDNLSPVFRNWLIEDPESPGRLFDAIPMPLVADGLAYGAIFLGIVILASIASFFIGGAIKALGMGMFDRTLGVFFGIFRAILLLGLIYLPFHLLMDQPTKDRWFDGSNTYPYVESTAEILAGFLPSEQNLENSLESIDEETLKRKLFENQFLPGGDEEPDSDPADSSAESEGYNPDMRDDMDNLFEDAAPENDQEVNSR